MSTEEVRAKIYQAAVILQETGLRIDLSIILSNEDSLSLLSVVNGKPEARSNGITSVRDESMRGGGLRGVCISAQKLTDEKAFTARKEQG